jgi:hypothetical protein
METLYLIVGIGGLLLVTVFINGIAEIAEQRAREKKMKVLRLKRRIDELSDFLNELKDFNLPKPVIDLLLNEILARFEEIELIDPKFNGINQLISDSKEHIDTASNQPPQEEVFIDDEVQLQKKLTSLRHLIQFVQEVPLLSKNSPNVSSEYIDMLATFRYDKINSHYFRLSQRALEENNFIDATNHIKYITNAISLSGHKNERLDEIMEQADFMLKEIDKRKFEYEMEKQRLRAEKKAREEAEKEAQKKEEDNL